MKLSPSGASIIVVAFRIAGVACQAAAFFVLVNLLPARDIGIFSAIYVFWGLARMLGPLGADHIIMRDVAAANASENPALGRALTWFGVRVVLLVGMALSAVAALILWIVSWAAGSPFTGFENALIAGTAPAFALIGILAAALRGFGRNVFSQAVESLVLHLLALAFIVTWSLSSGLSLEVALGCQATATWITVFIYLAALLRSASGPTEPIPHEVRRRVRTQSLEVWQALLLIGLADRAPNYISLILLGPVPTAILEVALRFGILPTIFTTGVSVTLSPIFAGLHVREEREAMGDTLAVGSWLAFVPSLCLLLTALVVGPLLLEIAFPPIYQEAFLPLVIIMLASAINAAYGLSSSVMLMTGHQRTVRAYSLLRLIGVIATGIAAGYWFGITGIAFSFLLGFVIFDIGLAQQVRPQLNVSGFLRLQGLALLFRTMRHAR